MILVQLLGAEEGVIVTDEGRTELTSKIETKESSERVGGKRRYASDMSSHSSGRRSD